MKVLQDPSDNRTRGVDLQNITGSTSETTEIRTQTQVEHTNVSQYNKYGAADIEELESARGYAEAAKKSAEEAALSEEAAKNSETVAFVSSVQAIEANNDAQDAAERARISAENAANSEQASYDSSVAAKNSEVEAERQASNASDSAAFAFESAESASRSKDLAEAAKVRSEEILAEVTPSVAAAAKSAADAQQAASSAATSANNAAESKLNAKESADVAKASEDIASSYVNAAKAYAEDAEASSIAAGSSSAEANTSMLEAQASAAGALANANASAASANSSAQSAASSASSADSSELSANASAGSAVTAAEEAASALDSKNIAVSSANTATSAANEATEAASAAKDSEDAAALSQTASANSASQALASKNSAEIARDAAIAAKNAAESAEGLAEGILEDVEASAAAAKASEIAAGASEEAALASQNQSKVNADAAIAAKVAAEASEESAADSENASAQSAASAAGSASSASTSASTATTKAAEAVVSAQAAEGSASTASTKASQASLSAANASASEEAAEGSASDSLASANASAASASDAADSEAVAVEKATAAANSATSADASADAAHASANAASASAVSASGSKTTAESAASAAESARVAAQNSASAASVSAANAADSEQRSQEIYEALMSTAVYRGGWNPQATQAYPDPKGINSTWDVFLNEGTASYEWDGVLWQSGDRLIYSTPDDQYFHINQVRGVTSVNGKSGGVLISATDVGAYSKSESDARYAETAGGNTFAGRNYFNQGITNSGSLIFNRATESSTTLISIPNVAVNATAFINWSAGNDIMSFTRKNDTSSSGASVTIHGEISSTSAPTATGHLTRKDYVDGQIATRLPVGGKAADSEKVDGIDGANIFHTGHLPTWNEVSGKPTTFTPSTHNHDTLYYTKAQADSNYVNQIATNLNYSVDWNTLDRTNTYNVYRGTGVTFTNAPPGVDYGTLLVIGRDSASLSFATQIYTGKTNNAQYIRSRNDGAMAWTAWAKIYNSNNKPTTSELGVYSKTESDARYAETAGANIFTSTNRFQNRVYLQNLESQPLVLARGLGTEASKDDIALLSMSDGGVDWTINNSDDGGGSTFQFNGVNTSDVKYNILSLTNTGVSTGLAQGTSGNSLTRKDYVDGQIATRLPTGGKAADSAKLNGVAESTVQTANTIVKRDSTGDVVARLLRTTYANQDTISGAIAFRVNNSTDNYTRYCSSPTAIRSWLSTYSKAETDAKYQPKDGTYTFSKTLTVGTSWIDTGIEGSNLATGSYVIQIPSVYGDGFYYETFTGFMSWYGSRTNQTGANEILLHNAGHADSGQSIYLRTIRETAGNLKLQISSSRSNASKAYTFNFRRLI